MDGFIKLGVAHTFQMGPFIDDTDGKTAETGLTIADTDVFISKHGGAFNAKAETTDLTGTGDARGYYDCILGTNDTDTPGTLKVCAHISGALPVFHTFQVIPAIIFDSLFAAAGTDYLPVDAVQWNGANVHAPGTAGVPLVDIHDQATALVDAIWDEVISTGHSTANSAGKIIYDNLNAPVATVDTVVDGLATELAKVPKSDSTVSWNATALAAINAQCDTAISDAALARASALATVDGIVDTILSQTASPATPGQIATVVWNTATRSITEKTGFSLATPSPTVAEIVSATAATAPFNKLTFTSGNNLDVNIKKVNDVTVLGDGNATPWGP